MIPEASLRLDRGGDGGQPLDRRWGGSALRRLLAIRSEGRGISAPSSPSIGPVFASLGFASVVLLTHAPDAEPQRGAVADMCLAQYVPAEIVEHVDRVLSDGGDAAAVVQAALRAELQRQLSPVTYELLMSLVEDGTALIDEIDAIEEWALSEIDDECAKEIVSIAVAIMPTPLGKQRALSLVNKTRKASRVSKLRRIASDKKLVPRTRRHEAPATGVGRSKLPRRRAAADGSRARSFDGPPAARPAMRRLATEMDTILAGRSWPEGRTLDDFLRHQDELGLRGPTKSKLRGNLGEAWDAHQAERAGHRVVGWQVRVYVREPGGAWVETECDLLLRVAGGLRCREIKTGPGAALTEAQSRARVGGAEGRLIRIADPKRADAMGVRDRFVGDLEVHCYARRHKNAACMNTDQLLGDAPRIDATYPNAVQGERVWPGRTR